MTHFYKFALILSCLALSSCGALFNQPFGPQDARIGETTDQTNTLLSLPNPKEPIVVGVYNFKDQTGQYKALESGSTFSTAVTQGATTILIKALEDSKWFTPIERENLGNLLNERNIIRSTRDEYRKNNNAEIPRIKPLLFAGILLEGGIVSYDTNILTGGAGGRYFGAGGSAKYRQDRITVYLRAVSTSSGEILKTVYVSKTILSQAIDVGLFRFVNFQRLLEVETGFTKNEPAQMAVTEAIEKAVEVLILEGIQDKLWVSADGAEADAKIVEAYQIEKELEASTSLYGRHYNENTAKHAISFNAGAALIDGDYSSEQADFSFGLGYQYRFSSAFSVGYQAQFFRLNASKELGFRYWWLDQQLLLNYRLLADDTFSPYITAGPGILSFVDNSPNKFLQNSDSFVKIKAGVGVDYRVSPKFSIFVQADYNYTFTDKLDNTIFGTRDDYYYNFGAGVTYYFGSNKSNNSIEITTEE